MSLQSEFTRMLNSWLATAKKITQLTALPSPVTTGDLFEVVRGGTNYKADGSQLPSGGGGGTWGSITGTLSAQTDLQAALDAKESLYRVFDRKTANYPLVLADGLKGIEMNVAGANTVTVPLNATQAFPVGTLIPVVQYGAGLTSIVFTGGVTSRSSSGNLDSPGQYAPMFLRKIATDEWYLWNGTAGGGAVSSVFGRTGAVVAASGDYSADQIVNTPTGGISAIDLQGAIDELDAFRPTFDEMNAAIQTALEGLSWKDSVRVATTVAGTLGTSFENGDTVDGVVLATNDSILIKNQADPTQNGIYVVAASGAPVRRADSDSSAGLQMATVSVDEGTSNANTTWIQTTDAVTIGASNIVFSQFGSSSPDASETVKGIVELATQAEVTTGTDDLRAITPLKLAVGIAARSPKVIQVACSDEVTPLTTGTKATFRMPYTMTLTAVRASLTTAQGSGSIFTVDIQEAGVTVLSTLITIDNTEKTSTTAVAAPVISDAALADDAEITIIITQIGNSTAIGLKVSLIGS